MYFTKETKLPSFVPLPLFIVGKDISAGAKIAYSFLLYRMLLSQKNGWADEDEHVFVIYPIKELAKDMGAGERSVIRSLNELSELGLIDRKKRGSKSNCIYLIISDEVTEMSPNEVTSSSEQVTKTSPNEVTIPDEVTEMSPNEVTVSDEQVTKTSPNEVTVLDGQVTKMSSPPIEDNTEIKYLKKIQNDKDNSDTQIYGTYNNVILRRSEFELFKEYYPQFWQTYINIYSYQLLCRKYPGENCAKELFESRKIYLSG